MQVAFLDLERMQLLPQSGLRHIGPAACLSGRLQLLRGQFGTMSQVRWSRCACGIPNHPLVMNKQAEFASAHVRVHLNPPPTMDVIW